MACIDKTDAKELIKKYRNSFEKMASKGDLEIFVRKIVSKCYYTFLLLETLSIGTIWYILSNLNSTYGSFFLLIIALIQSKLLLDNKFDGVEDNILEAAEEVGICGDKNENDETSEKDNGDGISTEKDKPEDKESSKA